MVACGVGFLSFTFVLNAYFIRSVDKQYHFRWLFGVGIGCFFCAGLLAQRAKRSCFTDLNRKGIFRIEMVASPAEKAKSHQCKVKILRCSMDKHGNLHGKAIVYLQKDSLSEALLYGDILMVEVEFQSPTGPVNPGFDYAAYLARQGIATNAYLPSGAGKKPEVLVLFLFGDWRRHFRARLLNIYKSFGIAGDEYAVLAALTLGYTDALQPIFVPATAPQSYATSCRWVACMWHCVCRYCFSLLCFMDKSAKTKVLKTVICGIVSVGVCFHYRDFRLRWKGLRLCSRW